MEINTRMEFRGISQQTRSVKGLKLASDVVVRRGVTRGLHYTTLHYTTPTTLHYTLSHNKTSYYTTLHLTTQHYTLQHNTSPNNTTLHLTTQHNTLSHSTTAYHTTLHLTAQHNTTQHCNFKVIQHYTRVTR